MPQGLVPTLLLASVLSAQPGTALSPRSEAALPADLSPLLHALHSQGFRVRIALPPTRQAYGQFVPASRTLWLSPLSFELGIARQTFLHEAAHAAQSCPNGVLRPIGWRLPLQPVVRNEISGIVLNAYPFHNRILEQEAFALQGQPNAVALLLKALTDRCRRRSGSL